LAIADERIFSVSVIAADEELLVAAAAEGFDVVNPTHDPPLPVG
jgi:hypothetical protein